MKARLLSHLVQGVLCRVVPPPRFLLSCSSSWDSALFGLHAHKTLWSLVQAFVNVKPHELFIMESPSGCDSLRWCLNRSLHAPRHSPHALLCDLVCASIKYSSNALFPRGPIHTYQSTSLAAAFDFYFIITLDLIFLVFPYLCLPQLSNTFSCWHDFKWPSSAWVIPVGYLNSKRKQRGCIYY